MLSITMSTDGELAMLSSGVCSDQQPGKDVSNFCRYCFIDFMKDGSSGENKVFTTISACNES